jgi:hypothetical protein
MTDEEAAQLIEQTAGRLGIAGLLTTAYARALCAESEGHPYVMKILLGEVAKTQRLTKIERIVAAKEDVLEALFERTYAGLSPAAKRMFLLLANWRSSVPRVALEATLLRSANERMDVTEAIEELWRSSLVELHEADDEAGAFIAVPLAAGIFGRRKIETSPYKSAVEADEEILQLCGVAQSADYRHGVAPRLEHLFRGIAERIAAGRMDFIEHLPMLEFIARRSPRAWLWLSQMHEELGEADAREGAKEAVRRFLETIHAPEEKEEGWERLARLCRRDRDAVGEIHALTELCELPGADLIRVSGVANRVNELLVARPVDSDEKRIVVRRLIDALQGRIGQGDGYDYSRLAWLYLHMRDTRQASRIVLEGLRVDPSNAHLLNLRQRIERESRGV